MDAVTTIWGQEGHIHSEEKQLCSETWGGWGEKGAGERDYAREVAKSRQELSNSEEKGQKGPDDLPISMKHMGLSCAPSL